MSARDTIGRLRARTRQFGATARKPAAGRGAITLREGVAVTSTAQTTTAGNH